MIALIKEGNNCDYCEFFVNRLDELLLLKGEWNGNKIGHGSKAFVVEKILQYFFDKESCEWLY